MVRAGDYLAPFSEEDAEQVRSLCGDRPIRARLTGAAHPRSLRQLRLYWACCRAVAANTDDPNWATPEMVHAQIRYALRWVDMADVTVFPDGRVHFPLRSISFAELPHMEACRYFERAWPVLAGKLGVTEEQLLGEAENE